MKEKWAMSKMAKFFAIAAAGMAALASGGDYMLDIPLPQKQTLHSDFSAAEMRQLKKRRKKGKAARKQRVRNRKKH